MQGDKGVNHEAYLIYDECFTTAGIAADEGIL